MPFSRGPVDPGAAREATFWHVLLALVDRTVLLCGLDAESRGALWAPWGSGALTEDFLRGSWGKCTHILHLEGLLLQFLHGQNVLDGNAAEWLVPCVERRGEGQARRRRAARIPAGRACEGLGHRASSLTPLHPAGPMLVSILV